MSACERKMTFPPSSRIPTSKLTRVRVEGLLKSKAQVCPPRSGSDGLPRFALNRIDDSSKAINSSAVCDSIERNCFIVLGGSQKSVRLQSPVGQDGGRAKLRRAGAQS